MAVSVEREDGMRRHKARFGSIGTVSHGTMRTEDLIPAFLDVADDLRLNKMDRARVNEIRRRVDQGTEADEEDGTEGDFFASDGAQEDVNDLFDILGNYAPPYAYFGANEGDGADYGYWPSMEALDEAVRDGEVQREDHPSSGPDRISLGEHRAIPMMDYLNVTTKAERKGWVYRMVVSDHGNVTLYYRNGREVWGIV